MSATHQIKASALRRERDFPKVHRYFVPFDEPECIQQTGQGAYQVSVPAGRRWKVNIGGPAHRSTPGRMRAERDAGVGVRVRVGAGRAGRILLAGASAVDPDDADNAAAGAVPRHGVRHSPANKLPALLVGHVGLEVLVTEAGNVRGPAAADGVRRLGGQQQRLLSRLAVGKSGCVAPGRRGGGGTEGIAHLDEAAAQGDPKHLPPAVLVPASNDHAGLQVVFVVVSHLADIKLVVS